MLRLWTKRHPSRPGVFVVSIEGKTLCISRQPMADGCRMLIKMGFPPSMLATMRHEDASADSFEPETLAAWADRAFVEGPNGSKVVPWKPYPEGLRSDSPEETGKHPSDHETPEKGD